MMLDFWNHVILTEFFQYTRHCKRRLLLSAILLSTSSNIVAHKRFCRELLFLSIEMWHSLNYRGVTEKFEKHKYAATIWGKK